MSNSSRNTSRPSSTPSPHVGRRNDSGGAPGPRNPIPCPPKTSPTKK